MEGLEVSVLNLSAVKNIIDFRIDANTYKKDYLRTEQILINLNSNSIENLTNSVQNFGAYSLTNYINFTETGVPFLMTENIRHNYINWNIQKYVDDESHKMLYKSHSSKGMVLVTMAGEYLGRVAVYDKNFVSSSNQAIAKLVVKEDNNAYFISTFLNSKHGQNQINRLKTITGQPNINMSLIKSLKVPLLSKIFETLIETIVKRSENLRDQSQQTYAQAEQMLLEAVGLQNFEPSQEAVNVKTFKESFLQSGRLDAEYYQPKYEEIIEKIKKSDYLQISQLVTIKKSIEPGSSSYQVEGIPFIRVSNLSKYGISNPEIHLDKNEFSEVIKPKKDTILLSKDGSVGIAYKVSEDLQSITSSAILHLTVDNPKVNADYLTLVLNSKLVQLQAERDAGGSIIQHWKPSEIAEVIIPILDTQTQTQIATWVQESFSLKQQSEQLLDIAKRAVEIAIEENEEIAMAYITANNQKLL
ncbi:restriction endonuclease subunit S [Flavobacterium inviolabile]|uniref:restriction endonuclease subunit S n=1 Tax=Flavobacterium inviolabile TaxID=2748320 RepID=UPI0015AADF86|nr:restriction endonuclease subunit S [Flavobacterium inviolabile]